MLTWARGFVRQQSPVRCLRGQQAAERPLRASAGEHIQIVMLSLHARIAGLSFACPAAVWQRSRRSVSFAVTGSFGVRPRANGRLLFHAFRLDVLRERNSRFAKE